MRLASLSLLSVGALALTCSQSGEPQEDRTLRKLKEAQAQNVPGPRSEDPNAELARNALSEPHVETLPWAGASVRAGDVVIDFRRATKSKALSSKRVTLTTEDNFVQVELSFESLAAKDVGVSMNGIVLKSAARRWPLARDAQLVGGSRDLELPLGPHDKRTEQLLFEVSDAELKTPLAIEIPSTPAPVTIELHPNK